MKYRLSTVHARKTYGADTTEVIDIEVADPISQLIIELAVTNVGTAAPAAHAIASLTKIELVDGSDVLFSLSGYEAEAADWYHNLIMRSPYNAYLSGMDVQRFIAINFGRHLWDPLLAFDPKRFTNPQLKLTLDVGAGGIASVSNKLQVWANMFDEKKITPVGFLMHKEIKSFPLTTAAFHEYTDLPTDHPYRKLFVRAQKAGTEPNQVLDNFKLSEDQDKRIIVDHGTEDILRTIAMRSPMMTETIFHFVDTTSRYFYCTPTTRVVANGNTWNTAAGAGEIALYDGDGGRLRRISATATYNAQFHVSGYLPHATWEIPFGDQSDLADWYDVSKVGSLKLDITTYAAAATDSAQVFLQQLRRY